ncbi:MAG: hydantoinase B/oxoprolinase family protein [Caldiserica bacterium]|jgi:N-methylhydantoinase B|nr:hydantoinase B/oxoprolinase family protein [Caldisericota bacterium]MDH7562262.1 hydantoinase B/oxoprolinase family protein [Caldisericota bacterium]
MVKDVVTLRIIKNALDNIAKEMFWTTIRTAKSSIIYETYDFAPALNNKKGDLISIGTGIPVFLGIMPLIAKSVLEDIEKHDLGLSPGDIFVLNDPYRISTHLNDVALAMPIFFQDQIVAIGTIRGHVNDVGGMNPGSWGPNATEIFQEGLIIPTSHFYKDGKLNKEVVRLILHNTRIPDFVYGDLEALAAALRYAYKRINDLCLKYGVEMVLAAMDERIADGKILARNRLKELIKGEFFAEEWIEKYEGMDEDLRISAKVKIDDEKFRVDFTDNPPQVKAPINTTFAGLYTAVATVFAAITDPHVPLNQGYLDPVEVICPEGKLFNAQPPAPVSCYWETMFYAVDLVWKAMAPHLPERLSAGHFLSVVSETLSMIDPRDNAYKILVEPNPGGWGGGVDKDGESCLVAAADGETYCHPAEVIEKIYPIRVECMKLNLDDGVGSGKYRGGFGMRKDYRLLVKDANLVCSINRIKYPPWGIDGGKEGSPNHIVILRDEKPIWDGGRASNFLLKEFDIVSIRSGGGGGWGFSFERPPELVLEDWKNGLISVETARIEYGVIIDEKGLKVDYEGTKKIREAINKDKKEK